MFAGAKSPDQVELVVESGDGLDLTTVTGTALEVERPDGTITSWDWTIASATTTTLHLRHTFAADGSDVAEPGNYEITGRVLTASSSRRVEPAVLPVLPD